MKKSKLRHLALIGFIAAATTAANADDTLSPDNFDALTELALRVETELQAARNETEELKAQLAEAYAFSDDLQLTLDDVYGEFLDREMERLDLDEEYAILLNNVTAVFDHSEEAERINNHLEMAVEQQETLLATAIAYETLIDNFQLQVNELQNLLANEIEKRSHLQILLDDTLKAHSQEKEELAAKLTEKALESPSPQSEPDIDLSGNIGHLMDIHQQLLATAIAYEAMLDSLQLRVDDLQVQKQTSQEEVTEGLTTISTQQDLVEVLEMALWASENLSHEHQKQFIAEIETLQLANEKKEISINYLSAQEENLLLTSIEEINRLQESNSSLAIAFTAASIEHSLADHTIDVLTAALYEVNMSNQQLAAENLRLKDHLAQKEIAERQATPQPKTVSLPSNSHLLQ